MLLPMWCGEPWPRRRRSWQAGDTLEGWVFLGGIIPFSWHRLTVAAVDHEARRLRSEEGGGLIRTWNHDIEVDAVGEDRCRYVDRIVIDAGVITPVVAGFAQVFYRYRQRRWRELARLLAATCRSA